MPPAVISGMITLEWASTTSLDEDGILQKLRREFGELNLEGDNATIERTQTQLEPPAEDRVWFCRVCLAGPWKQEEPAQAHLRAYHNHHLRHASIDVFNRSTRGVEFGLKSYWVCDTDHQGPWVHEDWADMHRKLNPGHSVRRIGKDDLADWQKRQH